jgi:serine phosphatase RsbU (regulator of sigma subunit)
MHAVLFLYLLGISLYIFISEYSEEAPGLFYLILGIITVPIVILYFEYRTRALRKNCKLLTKKAIVAQDVLQQKNVLSHKNKDFKDSLKYALRIQSALHTDEKEIHRLFPESFVLQRPKDIVSGDFCWVKEIDGSVYFSVVDCTGHGVPGAFMSLIGLEFFRQIIVERKIRKPSIVLSEMNCQFNKVFENADEVSLKDGMDLSFCAFHRKEMELEFAGALHSIYIVRNNEILEIKGDRINVGPDYGFEPQSFTNQNIKLEEEDTIYMFTDGYTDQFGGPEGKKFKYRRFRHLLLSIHKLPMDQQKKILKENIIQWMANHDQIDDITVVGIKPASYSLSESTLSLSFPPQPSKREIPVHLSW